MPHCLCCKKGIFFKQLFLAELYARANRPPSLRKFGNLSIRENLVMTSLYAHPSARTCTSPRLVFGAKLTILWATNGAARVKISMEVSCVRLTRKFSEIKFWSFAFCLVTLLVTLRENPTPPVPLLGQNFDRWSHARKLCNIYKVACRHTCGQWKPIFISVKVARTYLYSVVVMFLIRVFQNERFNRFLWLFASLINNDRTLRKRYLFSCR